MALLNTLIDFLWDVFMVGNKKQKPIKNYKYRNEMPTHESWIKISVPSDRIDVLETNMNIYLENPGRYEEPVHELKRITIYFYPDINGEKREYKQTLQNVDKTIFEFKMYAKGFVDLYFYDDSYVEFYTDVSFINKDVIIN